MFFGTGSPSYDHWGGNRVGDNLFGNCIIALEAKTGKRIWHYQTVHHDLWDYDIPCPPNLVQVNVNGKLIDAIAQPTKTGQLFVLDRFTGDPINVPARFFDNLNFAIFQEVVEAPGGGIARRITGIDEVIGYNKHSDGVLTRGMFEWAPVIDKHYFRGMCQSHLLENKIAAMAGFSNKRDIYDEMLRRAASLERMAERDLTHYDDVFDILDVYYQLGWEAFSEAIDVWTPISND